MALTRMKEVPMGTMRYSPEGRAARHLLLPVVLATLFATTALPGAALAQSQEAAQLMFRMQQLEESIRSLTGQVETLQYELNQMKQQASQANTDTQARLDALEGGGAGKTEAAAQSGGAMPAAGLPQTSTVQPLPTAPQESTGVATPAPLAPTEPTLTPSGDALGESRDPLLGQGGGTGSLGTLSDEEIANIGNRPLNLSLDGGTISNGDANAQYEAGYDAIQRGDYAFAEDQFAQFVALYPDDPQAADATNWLGEALLARGAYEEAADVLLTGFQRYTETQRAPDLLMKLGVALAGAGEAETACRTFAEVQRRYPDVSPAFAGRLAEERGRAQCPA